MTRYRVIFDDSCPICRAFVERLQLHDTLDLTESIPLSEVDKISDVPLPPPAQLRRQLHLILPDRSIVAGAQAVATLASLFPRSRPLGWVLRLPVIRSLARWVYGVVARHRLRLSHLLAVDRAKRK